MTFHGKDNEAKKSIGFYHDCDSLTVDKVITEIKENLKLQAKSMSLRDVLRDKHARNGVMVGCVVSAAMSFSGSSSNQITV